MTDDDRACEGCEKPVHLPHDPQCQHGHTACPECGHAAVCRDCAHSAELEEWAAHLGTPHGLEAPDTRPPGEAYAEMARDMRKRQAELEAIREGDRAAWLRYKRWADERGEGEG